MKRFALILTALVPALLIVGAAAGAGPRVVGAPETVFDWASQRCATWDIPDGPARAWRDADGSVRLIAGAERNRIAAGADLDHLRHDCAVVFEGARSADPGAYDDRSWIAGLFTPDGRRVEALVHAEYHGDKHAGRCPTAVYLDCWRNAVVAAVSEDGGGSFAPAGLVAALPYRYDGLAGRRTGYFNPSNILRDGDHLYAFVFAEAYRAQARGACLLRRPLEGGASDWRAWDGVGFGVRFADPYREDIIDPSRHVCAPLPGVGSTISSVVRTAAGTGTGTGGYLAVTPATRDGVSGIYAMTSPDLVHWSAPELLWAAPLLWRRDCAAEAAYAYPALLDAASPGFDSVGDDFWLYVTRMTLGKDCAAGPDRDLIRMRVSWPAADRSPAGSPAPSAAPPDPPAGFPVP